MNSIIENFIIDISSLSGEESIASSDNETVSTEKDYNYIDTLFEDELLEMENEVFLYLTDFLETNILQIANPCFEEKLTSKITDIIYDACSLTCDANRFNTSYDDIKLFVQQRVVTYTQTIMIPRSCKTSTFLSDIKDISSLSVKLDKLRNTFQPIQRSNEWYEFRHNLITASNIGKIIGTEAKKNSLIYEKCKPLVIYDTNNCTINTSSPLHWGQKYEPVTIMIYEDMYSTKIEDFGCIQHNDMKCLGRSPDGINVDITNARYCRMLEVKNIVNRDITGIPQHDYWVQCQVQMEVCDLDTCDFIETRIKECEEIEFYDIDAYKGVILYFVSKTAIGSKPHYVYMPLISSCPTEEEKTLTSIYIDDWIMKIKLELKETHSLYQTLYWHLDEISVVLIPRNKKWFQALIPNINETWNTIVKERISGFEHRAPKKRNTKQSCVLDQNETKIIHL